MPSRAGPQIDFLRNLVQSPPKRTALGFKAILCEQVCTGCPARATPPMLVVVHVFILKLVRVGITTCPSVILAHYLYIVPLDLLH